MTEARAQAQAVIVTGAGVGIGYALARSFALAGAQVAQNDLDDALAQRAAEAINAEAGAQRVTPYGLDVADVAAVRRMVADAATRFGGVDMPPVLEFPQGTIHSTLLPHGGLNTLGNSSTGGMSTSLNAA